MKRLVSLALALVLVSSAAFAGPLGDAAARAAALAAKQTAPTFLRHSHKRGTFLIVAGGAFAGLGAYVFSLEPESDPSNERWRQATGYLCVGGGALFLVLGALQLRHPNAPRVQATKGGISVVHAVTF